jgi:rod shape-determining protein MreC
MRTFLRGIIKSPHFMPVSIVVIISIIMIVLPLRVKTTVSRVGATSILLPFIELDKYLLKINLTFEQNRIIYRRLDSLSVLASTLMEDRMENERLRNMLGFNFELPYELVPAEVLAIPMSGPFRSILVDAGTDRGIRKDMPVISPYGIIGKTVASDSGSTTVQLLFEPGCKVSARVQRSRAMGIVAYTGGPHLSLTNVPADKDVVVGDVVISSGLGGIFPEGLYIGTVIESESMEGEMFRRILIDPGADFSILEEVFVIVARLD